MRSLLACAVAATLVAAPFSALHARDTVSAVEGSLSQDEAQRLLSEPTRLAASGNLEGASSKFEMILANASKRHGDASMQGADLLSSFGLFLVYTGFVPGGEAQQEVGRRYLHRAVAAYRATVGAAHPAVADALHIEAVSMADATSTKAEALFEEALNIRVRSLGEKHPDTRKTLALLADLRGAPARTLHDRVRVEAAAQAFEKLIAISPEVMVAGNMADSAAAVRFQLAAMYAQNRMTDRAIAEAAQARTQILKWPAQYRCGSIEIEMAQLENALEEAGEAKVSDIRRRIIEASPSDCAIDSLR